MNKYIVILIILFIFYYLFTYYFQPEIQNFTESNIVISGIQEKKTQIQESEILLGNLELKKVSAQKAVDDVKKQLASTKVEASKIKKEHAKIQKQKSQLINQLSSKVRKLEKEAKEAVNNFITQESKYEIIKSELIGTGITEIIPNKTQIISEITEIIPNKTQIISDTTIKTTDIASTLPNALQFLQQLPKEIEPIGLSSVYEYLRKNNLLSLEIDHKIHAAEYLDNIRQALSVKQQVKSDITKEQLDLIIVTERQKYLDKLKNIGLSLEKALTSEQSYQYFEALPNLLVNPTNEMRLAARDIAIKYLDNIRVALSKIQPLHRVPIIEQQVISVLETERQKYLAEIQNARLPIQANMVITEQYAKRYAEIVHSKQQQIVVNRAKQYINQHMIQIMSTSLMKFTQEQQDKIISNTMDYLGSLHLALATEPIRIEITKEQATNIFAQEKQKEMYAQYLNRLKDIQTEVFALTPEQVINFLGMISVPSVVPVN